MERKVNLYEIRINNSAPTSDYVDRVEATSIIDASKKFAKRINKHFRDWSPKDLITRIEKI